MKQSQEIGQLAKALVNFQSKIRVLPKPAQGYGYKYTPLDVVVEMIREPMLENGLAFIQMPVSKTGEVGLCTRLLHESGEWLEEEASLPLPSVGKANEAQAYGAGLTYLRRYALVSMLGLAADEDMDATMPASRNGQKHDPAKMADIRADIESQGKTLKAGFLADRLAMTGWYTNTQHALGAMNKWPDLPRKIAPATALKTETAITIFDWCINRKSEDEK